VKEVGTAIRASGGAGETRFLDSGASRHFEPKRENFVRIRTCKPYEVEVADGRTEKADVYYAPWMSNSLISITQLRKDGLFFSNKQAGHGTLSFAKSDDEFLTIKESHGMYPLITVMEAHSRLAHISPSAVRKLVREGMALGFEVDLSTPDEVCESCIGGKITKAPVPKAHPTPRSTQPFDLVWTDVWGPSTTEAKGGKRYYVSFTDDYTRYSEIYLLRVKSDAFEAYKAFAALVKTQFGREIRTLHSDRGGEFLSRTTRLR